MGSAASPWRVLRSDNRDLPRLLVRHRSGAEGYEVEITDLSRIWHESLRKDEIVERARNNGCPIDPGEDEQQYNIFLGTVDNVLTSSEGTSLALRSDQPGNNLFIDLYSPLPKPLAPFKWVFHLERQTEARVESVLVNPLLNKVSRLQRQIQSLISELHDKDRVIAKITDRLETSGNDLTTVFPGVANIKTNRKKSQREQLARHVRGLATFDHSAWEERISAQHESHELDNESLNALLVDVSGLDDSVTGGSAKSEWWKGLDQKTRRSPRAPAKAEVSNDQIEAAPTTLKHESASGIEDDDDFQVQNTPKHLVRNSGAESASLSIAPAQKPEQNNAPPDEAEDGSTTEEEDDLDAGPALRGNSSPAHHSQPERPHSNSVGQADNRPPNKHDQDKSQAPKLRNTLGMIGGKSSLPSSDAGSQSQDQPPTAAPPSTKLGMIGGRPGSKTAQKSDTIHNQMPSSKESSTPDVAASTEMTAGPDEQLSKPFPDEKDTGENGLEQDEKDIVVERATSEERADQRRDRLKRELEAKAKAPVKKKRRF